MEFNNNFKWIFSKNNLFYTYEEHYVTRYNLVLNSSDKREEKNVAYSHNNAISRQSTLTR